MHDGKHLQASDIDQIESDIFWRLGNTSKNIALDQFHPRLVTNAHLKRTGLDKYGVPLQNNDTSFYSTTEQTPRQMKERAQTSNKQFR